MFFLSVMSPAFSLKFRVNSIILFSRYSVWYFLWSCSARLGTNESVDVSSYHQSNSLEILPWLCDFKYVSAACVRSSRPIEISHLARLCLPDMLNTFRITKLVILGKWYECPFLLKIKVTFFISVLFCVSDHYVQVVLCWKHSSGATQGTSLGLWVTVTSGTRLFRRSTWSCMAYPPLVTRLN